MSRLLLLLLRLHLMLTLGGTRRRDDRGDVPGWVMIVVMTAALVGGITLIAQPQLNALLSEALNSVGG
jgi:hypothetical protein